LLLQKVFKWTFFAIFGQVLSCIEKYSLIKKI